MKLNTFKRLINIMDDIRLESIKKDKAFEKVFGGDTQIITEDWSKHIESMISTMMEDLDDTEEYIDWFFWETDCGRDGNTIISNNIEHKINYETIYKLIKGEL